MILVLFGHKSILTEGCMHNYNNQSSVSHFTHKCIVEPDMTTYITTMLDYFPERTVTLDVESMITCQYITSVLLLCSLARLLR